MKLIIAGSRTIDVSGDHLWSLLEHFKIENALKEIVCGGARGVDASGKALANEFKAGEVSVKMFPADWDAHGKSAGFKRNLEMGQYADALLLIWDGESKGSGHMRNIMRKLKKPIYEVILREE